MPEDANSSSINLKGSTALITGGSRGIGKAIALKLATAGCNITIAAKTAEPHPKLEGTIFTAASEIEAMGAKVLPLQVDIRNEEQIQNAVEETVNTFGGLDIIINNASAINLSPTENTEAKRFDLMQDVNVRGSFLVCKHAIPHLKKASNPHILNLSPPLNLNPKWFAPHLAYTLSKYGMSMIVLGLAEELRNYKVAVNALWPKTIIATAAVQNLLGGDYMIQRSRKPKIVADAAFYILSKPSAETTGNFFIDEDVLIKEGITDFSGYAVSAGQPLINDIFLDN